MSISYEACKGLAYPLLASAASCDHPKAKSKGYKDGWQLLMDRHDDSEMAIFCSNLPSVLSEAQRQVLLDGLAIEYAGCKDWLDFVDRSCENPGWKPSQR